MTCSLSASVWTRRTTALSLLIAGLVGCGSSPSGLLKNRYHYDNGCSEGIAAAVERVIANQDDECIERHAQDEVSADILARAERSLDSDEREFAQGYVACFERVFDQVYPSITTARYFGCPVDREDFCMVDTGEGPTYDRSLFEFTATETCPSYELHAPGCSDLLYQPNPDPQAAYLRGIREGTDCLAEDAAALNASVEDPKTRACRRDAYGYGWTIGHVACLNRTDGWRDAPEVEE